MTRPYSAVRKAAHVPLNCKQRLARKAYQIRSAKQQYATISHINHEVTNVAVLGGGITGLASAFYVSQSLPNANITLLEASPRLGGWLHSRQVDVGNGKVVFEQGPRNLRPGVPNGLITLDLVRDLGLESQLLMTSKDSPAAQNRFIYYPDHLVRMPGPGTTLWRNVANLWSEPVFDGLILGALAEVTKPPRSNDLWDESIGSFLSRRFGSAIADNLASAVFHGIYAGDIYRLSAQSILPGPWLLEKRHKSLVRGMLLQSVGDLKPIATNDLDVLKEYQRYPPRTGLLREAQRSSVFTFRGGVGDLTVKLEAKLAKNAKVEIKKNTAAIKLKLGKDLEHPKVRVTTKGQPGRQATQVEDFSHVISTIAGDKLALIAEEGSTGNLESTLGQTYAVTVMVVNLFFSSVDILPVHGFGYLLPRSVPFQQNPERALGVVFDSDASLGQDNVPGTKVTVMLGGHWWEDFDKYPDESQGAEMAKAILRRHLGINEEPRAVRVGIQRNCIPQYGVGHDDRMAAASRALESWNGRLRVAGNSYTGIGLNDCVRAARDIVKGLADGTKKTGLEAFVGGKKWSWEKPEDLKLN